MAGRTLGVLAVGAVLRLAVPAAGSFVTAPQRDPMIAPFTSPSVDVSADGRYVAFESYARLVPADTNDRRDIYVLDLETRRVTLESATQDVAVDTAHPRLSGNGRFLVFETSLAVEGDGYSSQIILCDRVTATSRVVSTGPGGKPTNGQSRSPDISDDGQIVVFTSTATNLVPEGDTNGPEEDVYVLDVRTGTIRRVSVDSAGAQPSTGASISPSVSGDGRWVAFASSAPLVLPRVARGPTPARRDLMQVYVRDLVGRTTTRVSVASRGATPDRDSWGPAINRDGRFVVFVSDATNLGSGGRNQTADVFLRDGRTGAVTLVSRTADGEGAAGTSMGPAISADGRFVAFQSDASNLVCSKRCPPDLEDINLVSDVFVFDREGTTMSRASEDDSGAWMEASRGPALDGSGHVLAFASRHPIDTLDLGDDFDVFVKVDAPASDGRPGSRR
jgi:Tol biopolymer transport system component